MYHLSINIFFGDNDHDLPPLKYPKYPILFLILQLSCQVKVKHWVNGTEGTTVVGLSARFGAPLPRDMREAQKSFAVLANPLDCCSNLTSKVHFDTNFNKLVNKLILFSMAW